MQQGSARRRGVRVALTSVLAATAFFLGPHAAAEPTLEQVEQKLEKIYRKAEIASEQARLLEVNLTKTQTRLAQLRGIAHHEAASYDVAKGQATRALIAQYQQQSVALAGQVLAATNPDDFLAGIQSARSYAATQSNAMEYFLRRHARAQNQAAAVAAHTARIKRDQAALAQRRTELQERAIEAQELLAELRAEERARLLAAASNGLVPVDYTVPAQGRAKAAVEFALSQVGKRYGWGAVGPDAYDCSGFTMAAWARGGTALPHSSAAQRGFGSNVPLDQLQAGDLVFYYAPISHVGIYIGNGLIAHAANPSRGVRVDAVNAMPISGATRPG